jgi:hypothetical protein
VAGILRLWARKTRKLILVQLAVVSEISKSDDVIKELKSSLEAVYKHVRKRVSGETRPPAWAFWRRGVPHFHVYLQGETDRTVEMASAAVRKARDDARLYEETEARCVKGGNYRSALAVHLLSKGGVLMPTDDKRAKKEHLALLKSNKKDVQKILVAAEKRAECIAKTINSSLFGKTTGVLIIDPAIRVERYLDSDIRIVYC